MPPWRELGPCLGRDQIYVDPLAAAPRTLKSCSLCWTKETKTNSLTKCHQGEHHAKSNPTAIAPPAPSRPMALADACVRDRGGGSVRGGGNVRGGGCALAVPVPPPPVFPNLVSSPPQAAAISDVAAIRASEVRTSRFVILSSSSIQSCWWRPIPSRSRASTQGRSRPQCSRSGRHFEDDISAPIAAHPTTSFTWGPIRRRRARRGRLFGSPATTSRRRDPSPPSSRSRGSRTRRRPWRASPSAGSS